MAVVLVFASGGYCLAPGSAPEEPWANIFALDGDNLVEETNSSGTAVARYAQGLNIDEPLAMLRSGATSFYYADGLGSITSLANSAGSQLARERPGSFSNDSRFQK